MKQEIRTITR